jgi:hypothetical protein
MKKTISKQKIKKLDPYCYYLSEFITDDTEKLPVKEWIEKYRTIMHPNDILWIIARKKFMSNKDLRLFAVSFARNALKLVGNPDHRSIEACDVSERYANGQATKKELLVAHDSAYVAYIDALDSDVDVYYDTVYSAYAAVHASDNVININNVVYCDVGDLEIDNLITYF